MIKFKGIIESIFKKKKTTSSSILIISGFVPKILKDFLSEFISLIPKAKIINCSKKENFYINDGIKYI